MRNESKTSDNLKSSFISRESTKDKLKVKGFFNATLYSPAEYNRNLVLRLRKYLDLSKNEKEQSEIKHEISSLMIPQWESGFQNLTPNAAINDILDKYWAGSAYTAAWYMGLINDTTFTGISASDTISSHAGWVEDTNYTEANRQTCAFSAASGGIKTLSSACVFSINATTTLKGAFIVSDNTKGGTTGTLSSVALYTEGDRAAKNGDSLSLTFQHVLV